MEIGLNGSLTLTGRISSVTYLSFESTKDPPVVVDGCWVVYVVHMGSLTTVGDTRLLGAY